MNQPHNEREHHQRQLLIDLPDLTHSDLVDTVRLLSAITDAFINHHQAALQQQCRHEQQLELFNSMDEEHSVF